MKLCFLANADSIHSYRWIKYFAGDDNYQVHWISLTPNIFSEVKNLKFHPLKDYRSKLLNIFFNLGKFKKLIEEIKPDLLNVHYAGVNGALGLMSGFHPLALTAWGSDILVTPKKNLFAKLLIRYILKRSDLITCDAKHMEEAMVKVGADPPKIKIINFGIDTKFFSPGKKDEGLEREFGATGYGIVISLRMLEPIYDIETFIKAASIVLKEIPDAKFIIGGSGSEEDYLKKLSKSLGISKNIRFVGWISQDDLPRYLRTSDIYVSTSLSDAGISSSTAEAMACGLPVIITDFGDNKEWVKDEENGLLVPPKNPEILAKKIIYLIKNKELGIKMGKKSRRMIEGRNNYYKEMEKMGQLYFLLQEKPPRKSLIKK